MESGTRGRTNRLAGGNGNNAEERRRELAIFRAYVRSGSDEHRDLLVRRYLPLARSLALRYSTGREPLDDLIQVANLGLLKAIDSFDPERGRVFAAFAVPTILGELRRHFRDHIWTLRLPRGLSELIPRLDKATDALTEEHGRPPTPAEIARHLGITAEEVLEGLEAAQARFTYSLDAPAHGDTASETTWIDTEGCEEPGYERVEASLAAAEAGLDEREWRILQMRFVEGLSQREIGAEYGLSQMQISRISRAALTKLLAAVRGGN